MQLCSIWDELSWKCKAQWCFSIVLIGSEKIFWHHVIFNLKTWLKNILTLLCKVKSKGEAVERSCHDNILPDYGFENGLLLLWHQITGEATMTAGVVQKNNSSCLFWWKKYFTFASLFISSIPHCDDPPCAMSE